MIFLEILHYSKKRSAAKAKYTYDMQSRGLVTGQEDPSVGADKQTNRQIARCYQIYYLPAMRVIKICQFRENDH